jgi:hypothetical protein
MGILRLARDHGAAQLEAACTLAVTLKTFSYRSIVNLLKSPPRQSTPASVPIEHGNVRGAAYFAQAEIWPC